VRLCVSSAEEWLARTLKSTVTFSTSSPSSQTITVDSSEKEMITPVQHSQSADWLKSLAMNGVLNTRTPHPPMLPTSGPSSTSSLRSLQPTPSFSNSQQISVPPPPTDPTQPPNRDQRKSVVQYQILEETDVPPQSPPRVASPAVQPMLAATTIDVFGQPVFNPASSSTSPIRPSPSTSSAAITPTPENQNYVVMPRLDQKENLQVQEEVKEKDPFDVEWSAQILNSARPNAAAQRNPFSHESAPVNV